MKCKKCGCESFRYSWKITAFFTSGNLKPTVPTLLLDTVLDEIELNTVTCIKCGRIVWKSGQGNIEEIKEHEKI